MLEKKFKQYLESYLSTNCSDQQIEQFVRYLNLMSKWNRAYNLTAITDPKAMVIHHILDSLSILPFLQGHRILDVGSGAGLPGIPLAIMQPDHHFTLLDSNGKKTRFLTQVKMELNLENVSVEQARVENYQSNQCFDCILTRAFAAIDEMLAKTQHLCCSQGVFLAMKGVNLRKDLEKIPESFKVVSVEELDVMHLGAKRYVVIIQKTG